MGVRRVARAGWDDLAPNAVGPLLPLSPGTGWAPHVLVGALAVMLAGFSWHTLLMDYGLANEQAAVLGITHALALLVCLYWPMAGWWLSLAMVVVTALSAASVRPLAGGPLWTGPSLAVHLCVLALVGLRVRPRVLVEMWLLTVAAGVVLSAELPRREEFPGLLEPVLLAGAALVAAGALRGRGEAMRRLARQQQISERERSRRELLEERARIARELHDVVAHHMSVVAIQAEAAPYRVADPPAELARGFETIRANALAAMDELHRILGLLRNETAEQEHRPQPTLAGLEELADSVREAGLTVALTVSGERRQVSSGVGLSAYRIVQESLSNVLRHAPGADVRVEVEYGPDRLEVRVANGPPAGRPAISNGSGHGVAGMRERAVMLGGELAAGPRPDGGYQVTATLPLPDAEGRRA
ncbi:Signal transduction histidine kinase [Thermomonospora echinospora]|uniref:histidine kinase n=1 Tax=Thermomonospora echinospora TaxID=1992 RepID=A0A1H6CA33_9ACTN|nr:histidine kinase [Thermomonospora echinospora]SEG69485.1 Signal transduction histidine kinase [Thermomonospora echinospora]